MRYQVSKNNKQKNKFHIVTGKNSIITNTRLGNCVILHKTNNNTFKIEYLLY